MSPCDATAATVQWRQCAHHTLATGGEEESHRANKGQWWEFGQNTRVTPLLFTRSAMGFLMTTESQDLGFNVSSKRWCLLTV